MLKFLVALLFVAFASGAFVEVDNSGHTFRISVNPASEVRFTKDGLNYRHLQELSRYCTVPGTPVALGGIGNWQCQAYDTLANLNCTGVGGLFFPVVKEENGVFTCAEEADTLAYLASQCTDGETVKFINGVWKCAKDLDTFRDLQLTCIAGSTLQWNGTQFVCVDASAFADSDILATYHCGLDQLVRFDAATSTFFCDNDFNTLPVDCSNGELVIYNGTTWICAPDSNYLIEVGIPTCNPATPYLKFRNNTWVCVDQFFVLHYIDQPGFLTYLQTANILSASTNPVAFTNYTVLWGSISQATLFSTAPPVFPFNGTITSTYILLQNFQSNSGATVALDFAVNGQLVSNSISFNIAPRASATAYFYLSPVFSGQSFQAGQTVNLGLRVTSGDLSTTPPNLSSIYVAVYISVTI